VTFVLDHPRIIQEELKVCKIFPPFNWKLFVTADRTRITQLIEIFIYNIEERQMNIATYSWPFILMKAWRAFSSCKQVHIVELKTVIYLVLQRNAKLFLVLGHQ
jgi:hypothetical protein